MKREIRPKTEGEKLQEELIAKGYKARVTVDLPTRIALTIDGLDDMDATVQERVYAYGQVRSQSRGVRR